MSRAEVYNAIKARGLQDECVKRFGKNFTMCKTQDLIALLVEGAPVKEAKEGVAKEKVVKEVKETRKEGEDPVVPVTSEGNVAGALEVLLEDLYAGDVIEDGTYGRVLAVLKGAPYEAPEGLSKAEIYEMFDFVD